MNIQTLESIGLTKGESEVYIALIKIGSTSTGKLIKESNVSRSKVYDILERLKKKGLVTEIIKENTKYFEATDPKRILGYLEEKRNDIDHKIESSKKVIIELDKIKSTSIEKQEARVYTGIEGWKTVYDELLESLNTGDEYLAFGLGREEIQNEKVGLFIKKFHMKRAEKKIKARIIVNENTKAHMKEFSKLKYYEYKFTDVNFPTNIAVFGDNVLTLVWGDKLVAFLITSKQVANKYRIYFEEVWKKAKK